MFLQMKHLVLGEPPGITKEAWRRPSFCLCLFVLPIAPLLHGCTSHPPANCPSFSPPPSRTCAMVWPLHFSIHPRNTRNFIMPILLREGTVCIPHHHQEKPPHEMRPSSRAPSSVDPSAILLDGVGVLFPLLPNGTLLPLCQHLSGELWCCFMCLPLQLDRRLLRDSASSSAWAHHLVQPGLARRANE